MFFYTTSCNTSKADLDTDPGISLSQKLIITGSRKSVLVVILSQVFSLLQNAPASEVERDLTVFARGVAKLLKLLLPLSQGLALPRVQPLVGVGGKIIRLIVQHLSSANAVGVWDVNNVTQRKTGFLLYCMYV